MVVRIEYDCRNCNRTVSELFEVGWEQEGTRIIVGLCCEDCAVILKAKVEEMARHIRASKLN